MTQGTLELIGGAVRPPPHHDITIIHLWPRYLDCARCTAEFLPKDGECFEMNAAGEAEPGCGSGGYQSFCNACIPHLFGCRRAGDPKP